MRSRLNSNDILRFHRAAVDAILRFLSDYGISTLSELNSVKGRRLLDTPLWKLLETQGKYGGRFISQGVYELERKLQRQVTPSTGTWPERLLTKHLGPHPKGGLWRKSPDYCCQLDHVSERSQLIPFLLKKPERAQEILDELLLGCVILKSEHRRLSSLPLDVEDPWRRYRDGSRAISVWDRQTRQWHDLSPRKKAEVV